MAAWQSQLRMERDRLRPAQRSAIRRGGGRAEVSDLQVQRQIERPCIECKVVQEGYRQRNH